MVHGDLNTTNIVLSGKRVQTRKNRGRDERTDRTENSALYLRLGNELELKLIHVLS